MKNYRVTFEVFMNDGTKGYKSVIVEAGNKKLAAIRAMSEINKIGEYATLYKNIHTILEVA